MITKLNGVTYYLNEGNFYIVFNVSILLTDIFHDEITQFTAKLHTSRATSNDNTM